MAHDIRSRHRVRPTPLADRPGTSCTYLKLLSGISDDEQRQTKTHCKPSLRRLLMFMERMSLWSQLQTAHPERSTVDSGKPIRTSRETSTSMSFLGGKITTDIFSRKT